MAAQRIRAVALYEPPASLAGAPMLAVLQKCRALVDEGRNADAVTTFLSSVSDPGSSVDEFGPALQHRAEGHHPSEAEPVAATLRDFFSGH